MCPPMRIHKPISAHRDDWLAVGGDKHISQIDPRKGQLHYIVLHGDGAVAARRDGSSAVGHSYAVCKQEAPANESHT